MWDPNVNNWDPNCHFGTPIVEAPETHQRCTFQMEVRCSYRRFSTKKRPLGHIGGPVGQIGGPLDK